MVIVYHKNGEMSNRFSIDNGCLVKCAYPQGSGEGIRAALAYAADVIHQDVLHHCGYHFTTGMFCVIMTIGLPKGSCAMGPLRFRGRMGCFREDRLPGPAVRSRQGPGEGAGLVEVAAVAGCVLASGGDGGGRVGDG